LTYLGFALGVAALCACVAPLRTARAAAPDTVWVTVDGHRLHLLVEGHDGPTIVLEAGYGSTHRSWGELPPQLTPHGRVVSYDRAGFGQSEVCSRPRTARVIAEELHEALVGAGMPAPYLLVGWSFGGSLVRVFASMYPEETVGLVLVDPVTVDFYARAEREQPELFRKLDEEGANDSPAGEQGEAAAWDTSLAQTREADALFRGPALLLSSPRTDLGALGPIWTDEHRRWSERVPRTRYVLVEGVGHAIHRDRPAVVVTAVKELLSPASRRRPR